MVVQFNVFLTPRNRKSYLYLIILINIFRKPIIHLKIMRRVLVREAAKKSYFLNGRAIKRGGKAGPLRKKYFCF